MHFQRQSSNWLFRAFTRYNTTNDKLDIYKKTNVQNID